MTRGWLMAQPTICIRQHFVSQFYLKQFADPMFTKNLQVFLCRSGKWEPKSPKQIGWSPHLTSYYGEDGILTDAFDLFVTRSIEEPAATVMKKLAVGDEISEQERAIAAMFISLTAARSPTLLKSVIDDHVTTMNEADRDDSNQAAKAWCEKNKLSYSEETIKEFLKPTQLGATYVWMKSLCRRLMQWNWHFVATTDSAPFVVSDRPVFSRFESDTYLLGLPFSSTHGVIIFSDGMINTNHPQIENVRAMNAQTISGATDFIAGPSKSFPGDERLSIWRERALEVRKS